MFPSYVLVAAPGNSNDMLIEIIHVNFNKRLFENEQKCMNISYFYVKGMFHNGNTNDNWYKWIEAVTVRKVMKRSDRS